MKMKTKIFIFFIIATIAKVNSNPVDIDQTEILDADKEFTAEELEIEKVSFASRFSDSTDDPNFDSYETYQTDIILTPEQKESLNKPDDDSFFDTRTGILDESLRWPTNRDGKVIVPYVISDDYCKW